MCIRDSSRRRGCCTRRSGSSPAAVRRGWERVEGPETRKPLNRAAALGGEPRAPRRGERDDAWDRVEAFPLDTSRVPKGFHPNHLILGSDLFRGFEIGSDPKSDRWGAVNTKLPGAVTSGEHRRHCHMNASLIGLNLSLVS